METLLDLLETLDDARALLRICARRGVTVVHREREVPLDATNLKTYDSIHYLRYSRGLLRLNLGANFGDHWRVEPALPMGARGPSGSASQPALPMGARGPSGSASQPAFPRGKTLTGATVHLAGEDWPQPRAELEAFVTKRGGTLVGTPAEADLVVFGGTLTDAERQRLGAEQALLVDAIRFQRVLPRPRATSAPSTPKVRLGGDQAKIWKLLSARNLDDVRQGLALLTGLGDVAAFDALLAEVSVDADGRLVRGKRFAGSANAQPFLDVALLGALSAAPEGSTGAALRRTIRALSLSVEALPSLVAFPALDELAIVLLEAFDADDLRELGPMPALRTLSITSATDTWDRASAPRLRALDGLEAPLLETLRVRHTRIANVDALGAAPALRVVDLSRNDGLLHVDGLSAAHATLEEVLLSRCTSLVSIDGLAGTIRLGRLSLEGATKLTSLRALAESSALSSVELSGCASLGSLEGLRDKRLEAPAEGTIAFDGCASLTSLRHMPTLSEGVKTLRFRGCGALEDLSGLERAVGVTVLDVDRTRVRDLTPLAGLTTLQVVRLASTRVVDATPLGALPSVSKLLLDHCAELETLPASWSGSLEEIGLSGCAALTSIAGLRSAQRSLDLSGCTSLRSLDGLEGLPSLRTLSVQTSVQDLSVLSKRTDLTSIGLLTGGEAALEERVVAALAPIPNLSLRVGARADVHYSDHACSAADLSALARLHSVVRLDLSRCIACEDLRFLCDLGALSSLSLGRKAALVAGDESFQSRAAVAALQQRLASTYGLAVAPPEATPSMSKEAKKRFREIKAALVSGDPARARQGLAALASEADGAVHDALFEGLDPSQAFTRDSRPEHLGTSFTSVKIGDMPVVRSAALAALVGVPDTAAAAARLRAQVRTIHWRTRDGEPLPTLRGFDALEDFTLVVTDHTEETARTGLVDLGFIGAPPKLARLALQGCRALTSLGRIGECPLTCVRIEDCGALSDLSALQGKALLDDHGRRQIDCAGAGVLQSLSFLPTDAESVKVRVDAGTDVSALRRMPGLRRLDVLVRGAGVVVPTIPSLVHLSIGDCDFDLYRRSARGGPRVDRMRGSLPRHAVALEAQPQLEGLSVTHCSVDLSQLAGSRARSVHLRYVTAQDLRGAGALESIGFHACVIRSLDGLQGSRVRELNLAEIDGLEDVSALRGMGELQELHVGHLCSINGPRNLSLRGEQLGTLPQVGVLSWTQWSGSLAFLAGWTGLRELRMYDAGALPDKETLTTLPQLRTVYLRGASEKRSAWPDALQEKVEFVRSHR
jgi:hypothetical protein